MKLPLVTARIFGPPLIVAPQKAAAIVAGLSERLGVTPAPAGEAPPPLPGMVVPGKISANKPYVMTRHGVAVIAIDGTLAHHAAAVQAESGVTGYGEMEALLMDAGTDPSVRAILLDVNSPGGEASSSAFELAGIIREIRKMKPVWAVADEMALSGGYLLASAASRLFMPLQGYVGSIGVIAMHLDRSAADRQQGLSWTFVYAGKHKNDLNPHEPLDTEERKWIQAGVDEKYERFVEAVALNRPGLTPAAIRATEARIYRTAAEALKVGLVDGQMNFRGALAALSAELDRGVTVIGPSGRIEASQPDTKEPTMSEQKETLAAAPAPTTATTATPPAATATTLPPVSQSGQVVDLNAARGQGYADAQEIVELCALAGRADLAAGFMAEKLAPAQVRSKLQALRADAGAKVPGIDSTHNSGGKPAASIDMGGIYSARAKAMGTAA